MQAANKVSLSSLNVKNLKSNHAFTSSLVSAADISFLSELWLRPNEINLLKKITDKTILFRSDIDEKYGKGRPFGGRVWIINNSFKLINSDFLNRHVSYVQLEKNGVNYFIIGVYMPFDNPQKKWIR